MFPTRPPKTNENNLVKKENRTSGQVSSSLPGRPGDVNKWGREGEKFRPGMNNNPNNQVIQQQSDNMQGNIDFKGKRNTNLRPIIKIQTYVAKIK